MIRDLEKKHFENFYFDFFLQAHQNHAASIFNNHPFFNGGDSYFIERDLK